MTCKTTYVDAANGSEVMNDKYPERARVITKVDAHFHNDEPSVKLEYVCTTNTLVALFALLHMCVDCLTLFAIFKKRYHLIIPFLAVIVFSIIMQVLFFGIVLAGATLGEFEYDVFVLSFVSATFMLNIYLFVCAKRLYEQLRDAAIDENENIDENGRIPGIRIGHDVFP
jgi:hypothetical protein